MRWVGFCILSATVAVAAASVGAVSARTWPDPEPHAGGREHRQRLLDESIAATDPPQELTGTASLDTLSWRGNGSDYCIGDDYFIDAPSDAAVDLLLIRSEGACRGQNMTFELAYRRTGFPDIEGFEIGFDLDLDPATGCDGFDGFVVADFSDAAWITATSCESNDFVLEERLFVQDETKGSQSVFFDTYRVRSVTAPVTGVVEWYAGVLGNDGDFDGLATTFLTPAATRTCTGAIPDGTEADGYWLSTLDGEIFGLGSADGVGHICEPPGGRSVVDLATFDGATGWYALQADGGIRSASVSGGAARDRRPPWPWQVEAKAAVALLMSGRDDWLVAYDNGVVKNNLGQTPYGDLGGVQLNAPIIDAQLTPSGNGYWLIGADGGVFSFGDAEFSGSTGSLTLNEPVVGMAPDPDGNGYWLVATDGGVFAFDSPFVGSIPGILPPATTLNRPIIAMEPYGNGYLLLGTDGGVFNFSNRAFAGSLGDNPPDYPVVAIQPVPAADE
ncbi:MAG: hypothetical protein AAGD18_09195 [Actinomycetota bacterium]